MGKGEPTAGGRRETQLQNKAKLQKWGRKMKAQEHLKQDEKEFSLPV